jgi:hypothetical protein
VIYKIEIYLFTTNSDSSLSKFISFNKLNYSHSNIQMERFMENLKINKYLKISNFKKIQKGYPNNFQKKLIYNYNLFSNNKSNECL